MIILIVILGYEFRYKVSCMYHIVIFSQDSLDF